MKIGQKLFQFPKATLLLVLDGQNARLFRAFDGLLTERAKLSVTPAKQEGRRTLFRASGRGTSGRTGGPSVEKQRSRLFLSLAKLVNTRALEELRVEPFAQVILCAPQQLLAQAQRQLHPYLRKRLRRTIGSDLVHEHPRAVVEAVTSALML